MYQHNELQVQVTQCLSPFLYWASNTRLCSSSLPLWHLVRFQRWCAWRSSPQYILAKKRQVRFSRETFTALTPCERKLVKAQKVRRYKEATRLWHFDSSLKSSRKRVSWNLKHIWLQLKLIMTHALYGLIHFIFALTEKTCLQAQCSSSPSVKPGSSPPTHCIS